MDNIVELSAKPRSGPVLAVNNTQEDELFLSFRCLAKLHGLSAYDADSRHYFSRTMLIVLLCAAVAQLSGDGAAV